MPPHSSGKSTRSLPVTQIEIIRDTAPDTKIRAVLFDFDGTLSLIRSGWMDVMVPMMADTLCALKTGEKREDVEKTVRGFVTRLTGKQTIYQMIALAEQVKQRGGIPLEPVEYKHNYLSLLWEKIKTRVKGLENGTIDPDRMLVPGSIALLKALKKRKVKIFVASGTDEKYAAPEAALLGITPYIEEKVHGAVDNYEQFSKHMVIQQIIKDNNLQRGQLAGFGDGYVEIEDVKSAGGIAVAVATDEPECKQVDQWKRERLINAGADIVVPHYLEKETLLKLLFPE